MAIYRETQMSLQEIKSTLAKLLATEDLIVEHKQVETASFNVETRVLTLPLWEKATNSVYDMLVGHEVSHALFTPNFDWSIDNPLPHGVVNVVEDARVEKLMKRKYLGIAKTFFNGYSELHSQDFFSVNDLDIDEMNLADRINLFFKIGRFIDINFTEEEIKIRDLIEASETFDDTLYAAKVLNDYCEEEMDRKGEDAKPDDDEEFVELEMQSGNGKGAGQGEGEGDPYTEADEVNEFVRNLALDKGFTDEQANILGRNAASTYLDIWLDGTYVMEKALAAGLSYTDADQAVERWAISGEHGYNDWFERWGEADPEKDWMPDENTYGAYLDSIIGTTIELRDPSEIRKDIEVSMRVYENLNYNTDTLQWEGGVFSEADQISQAFYDRAIEIGLTEDQAIAIQRNNRNAYIDTWMEGTYIYQEKIYEGYSSEEADQYVESWFDQSRYNDYWSSNENNWGIVIEEDDEGNITVVIRPLTVEEKIQMKE